MPTSSPTAQRRRVISTSSGAGLRVARGVVVDEQDAARRFADGGREHLARVDQARGEDALADEVLPDHAVSAVEEYGDEPLLFQVRSRPSNASKISALRESMRPGRKPTSACTRRPSAKAAARRARGPATHRRCGAAPPGWPRRAPAASRSAEQRRRAPLSARRARPPGARSTVSSSAVRAARRHRPRAGARAGGLRRHRRRRRGAPRGSAGSAGKTGRGAAGRGRVTRPQRTEGWRAG